MRADANIELLPEKRPALGSLAGVLPGGGADPLRATRRPTLEERSITCRNAWDLPTFDINEAGQVHTYICYLAKLPYEDQLYWKSFNEWPRGPFPSAPTKPTSKGLSNRLQPLGLAQAQNRKAQSAGAALVESPR